MFTTSLNDAGRVIVIDDAITNDTPQNFVVSIKNESDWNEIHNYIYTVVYNNCLRTKYSNKYIWV